MTYKDKYGAWAGRPAGSAPDFTRCCEEVTTYIGGWPRYHQCARKRGHGPDGAYCKQHDPVAVKAREEASQARYTADYNKRRYGFHGEKFFNVLKEIAEGHNDARGLAQETIDKFMEGMKK